MWLPKTSPIFLMLRDKGWVEGVVKCSYFSSNKKTCSEIQFSHARHGPFIQPSPQLHCPFAKDLLLQRVLKNLLPEQSWSPIFSDLDRFGDRICSEINELHIECDRDLPRLQQFDALGNRIDRLITCSAWKRQHDIAAEEGLVAIGYDSTVDPLVRRLHQFAKNYLYCPSAGLYSCPIAMTDGAAKVIQELNLKETTYPVFERLTSREHNRFWTSGQWMTERRGGSDVAGGTDTIAIPTIDGMFDLYGYKWFSSATDADVAFTLARSVTADGNVVKGTKGLSLYLVQVRNPDGYLNGIQMVRLKDKLGTRQVPTAELLLDGTKAVKVSDDGRGVASISHMLNMTRLHNAVASVGAMRRMIQLATDYSGRRKAFGSSLNEYPLHMQTLAQMEIETRGCFLLLMECVRLLGLQESGDASTDELLLYRLLTPILKLYTAKKAVAITSEGLEAFGGLGYLEDSGLPGMLRDAQVLPIWEGTTNVLSLDVLRHLAKEGGSVLTALRSSIKTRCKKGDRSLVVEVTSAVDNICGFCENHPALLESAARDLSFSIAHTYIAMLLIEQATSTYSDATDIDVSKRWVQNVKLNVLDEKKYIRSVHENNLKLLM